MAARTPRGERRQRPDRIVVVLPLVFVRVLLVELAVVIVAFTGFDGHRLTTAGRGPQAGADHHPVAAAERADHDRLDPHEHDPLSRESRGRQP